MSGGTILPTARMLMIAGIPLAKGPNRCYCPDCQGSGFDRVSKGSKRHSRQCQRCRGKGFTEVGSTKR